MDQRFLMEVTEGYLVNHNVHSEFAPKIVDEIRNNIYEDLISLPQYLRDTDPKLYEEVYFSNRLQQNKILETYLNIRYAKQEVIETDPDEIMDEGVITGTLGWIGSQLKSFIMWTGTLNPYIQIPLYAALLYMFWKNQQYLSKKFFGFLKELGKFLDTAGKFLTTKGRYFQFRYAVIQKNFESCYKKCGIEDLSKMDVWTYFNKHSGDSDSGKATCLANCFVMTHINLIQEHLKLYLMCIKQTKDFDNISKLSSAEFFEYTKTKNFKKYSLQTNSICNEYIEITSEYIEKFDDLLDYFYQDASMKRNIMNKLMQSMSQTRNEVGRMQPRQIQQYKKF